MTHYPSRETFQKLAEQHDWVPVWRRLVSDALTPVSAFHRLDDGGTACLFESVIGGEKVGRYSFLASRPLKELHDGWLASFARVYTSSLVELRRRVERE